MFQEPLRVDLVISGTGLRVRSVSLRPPSEDADVLPPPAVTDVPLGDAGRIRFEFAIKVTTDSEISCVLLAELIRLNELYFSTVNAQKNSDSGPLMYYEILVIACDM